MIGVKDNIKSEKNIKDKVKEANITLNIKPVKKISNLNDYNDKNECKLISGLVNYII